MNSCKTDIKIRMAVSENAEAVTALLYEAFAEYEPLYTKEAFAVTTPFLLPAIRLYESFGFTQQGEANFYGTSLIKMRKNIEHLIKIKTEKNDYAK